MECTSVTLMNQAHRASLETLRILSWLVCRFPIWHWRTCEREILNVKRPYRLSEAEIHTAWMLRKYPEQNRIPNFDSLNYEERRSAVERERRAELLRLQARSNHKLYKQTDKNFRHTNSYIHLTHTERKAFVESIADSVSKWGFARLFAECVDKIHFDPARSTRTLDEQAFEQIVSRFEQYLQSAPRQPQQQRNHGLLIHDNNPTVAHKHTNLMKSFHQTGTLWTSIQNIIETPLFVDSQLTSMVQIADVCAYALRRYLENSEGSLFDRVFQRLHFRKTRC